MLFDKSIILFCIVIAHLLFAQRLAHLWKLVNLGKNSFSHDHGGSRIKSLLVKGFGQRLVLRELSGIGHLFIFWGFFFLSFGTVENLLAWLFNEFSFAPLGPFYYFMNSGQDIFGVLVILALLVSIYRRIVLRPVRLEGDLLRSLEAYFIIALILIIVVLNYWMGFAMPKQGLTPVSDFLHYVFASGTEGVPSNAQAYAVLRSGHNYVVLFFLAYLLYSKHCHIVFALPNIYLKENKPPGLIAKVDMDTEGVEVFGAQRIEDFTKKDLLDLFACTDCGRCQEACPAYRTGKLLSPKKIIQKMKRHLHAIHPGLLDKRNANLPEKLFPQVISGAELWSCTTCFACDDACPVENSPMNKIIKMRQANVLMEGNFPEDIQRAMRNIETQFNPWGLPQEQRADWAEGLGVETLAENCDVDYLFFVGCAGAYDQRYKSVTIALVKLFREAGLRFGILGKEELCTGDSAKRVGNDYLAQELAKSNVELFNRYKVSKIITSCPHCFNTIKNEYPQYGGNYEVIHHSELLRDLIVRGRLKPISSFGSGRLAYHDSCYLGRYNGIMDEPRDMIKKIGIQGLVELPRNRRKSFCCGAGGGMMWLDNELGTRMNRERAREVIESGVNAVATACPFCMNMLRDGLKQEEKEHGIQLFDISELISTTS